MNNFIREYEIKESHVTGEKLEGLNDLEKLKKEYTTNTFASFMLAFGEEIEQGKQYTCYKIEKKIIDKEVLFLNGKIVQEDLQPDEIKKAETKTIKVLQYNLLLNEISPKIMKNNTLVCATERMPRHAKKRK